MHGANDTMRSAADTLHGAADTLSGAADTLCGAANTVCGAADMMGVAADTMHGAADMMTQWVSQDQCQTPLYGKNKLILNQYLGIFMHFETIFFFFFLIWKMDFFRPTPPLNLENSRIFFFFYF